MAKNTKKNTAEVAAPPPPAKGGKKAKVVEPVAKSVPAVADATEPKKRRKSGSIDDIIELLKNNKIDKAIVALEKLSKTAVIKKERKSRPPTAFNKFVSEKMKELKDSGMTTNERMKECARLWKEHNNKA